MSSIRDRYLGTMLGLACGDAVGTAVEFSPRGSFSPVVGMSGGGPFRLKPGQWTDDTSMALCLAESLVEKSSFDPHDQMTRYLNWWKSGYFSSTGECFDIGNTIRAALVEFQRTGEPYAGSPDARSAGNGSLMRLAPIVMFGFKEPESLVGLAAASSRTTHGAAEAIECCQLLSLLIHGSLSGMRKESLLPKTTDSFHQPQVREIATGAFLEKPYSALIGSGYCVKSLEAALWCFFNTTSFKDAILSAVNLGDDADTTGAITGQLAGAYYGAKGIPDDWIELLAMRSEIEVLANRLYEQFGT